MASGIVPICAREGGAYGIIKEDINGLIAEPRNAVSMSEKIEILVDNPDLRSTLALNALAFAKTMSWEKIFDSLFDSYLDVINNHKNNINTGNNIPRFDFPIYTKVNSNIHISGKNLSPI